MTLNQIDILKKMKTRLLTVFKTCPEILMTQKMMVFTNDLGNEKANVSSANANDNDFKPEPSYKSNDK